MDTDLRLKLNPITKLRIYREVKRIIFYQMDSKIISPDRAEEVLKYVKENVVKVNRPDEARAFYKSLWDMFVELQWLKKMFEKEEEEKIDKIFSFLLDEFMESGNIDLANEIMEQMNDSNNNDIFLEQLKNKYPIEMQKSMKKILNDNFAN